MESVCVADVEAVTSFLCRLLNASSNKVSNISIEHSVLHWENRQVLIHGQELDFLLSNNRLFLNVESVSLLVENATLLFPAATVTHYSSTSLPGCLIKGPGHVEIAALQCGIPGQKHDNIYFSALRTASELHCAQELNLAAPTVEESARERAERNPAGVQFRSLFPLLYDSKSFRPISCNTSLPIPFKTEMFEGEAVLLVNSSDDPSEKLDQTDWTLEVQVQGKFTRLPEGPLFIGAQISKKMELGMLTRAMCRTIMQFARSNLPLLHHSFGDRDDVELPHIVGPLWMMSDRVVVTPKGETPPKLGSKTLPEDDDSRRARRKNSSFDGISVDLDSTYSFSTDTANIELVEWSVVNIPLLSKIDLHTFWLDADLILCAYELKSPTSTITHHRQEDITYCFRLLLRHASNHHNLTHENHGQETPVEKQPAEDPPEPHQTSNRLMRDLADCGRYEVISTPDDRARAEDVSVFGAEDEDETESVFMNDAGRSNSMFTSDFSLPPPGSSTWGNFSFVPVIFEVDDFRKKSSGKRRLYYGIQFPSAFEVSDSLSKLRLGDSLVLHSFMECTKTLTGLMPRFEKPGNYARLDECAQRRLQLQALFSSIYESVVSNTTTTLTQRKMFTLFNDKKPTEELLDPDKNKSSEYGVSSRRHREGIGATLCHSRVCVQLGRFFWSEEYMMLTSKELVFVKPTTRLGRTARVRIPLKDISDVSLAPYDQGLFPSPGPEFSFLFISTFSRQYHVAVRGHAVRDRWLDGFDSTLPRRVPSACEPSTSLQTVLSDTAKSPGRVASDADAEDALYLQDMNMLSSPAGFNLGDRVILNGRILQGNPFEVIDVEDESVCQVLETYRATEMTQSSELGKLLAADEGYTMSTSLRESRLSSPPTGGRASGLFPGAWDIPFTRDDRYVLDIAVISKIVADALDLMLAICERMIIRENDVSLADSSGAVSLWMLFMDKISVLSNIEIDQSTFDPSSGEAVAMFLNLYHTLLLHSFLAVRVPSSALNWPSLFNCCAYEAFGDVFSLSELEHGVLRNGMSKPSSLVAQMLIPKSTYSFALTVRDIRLLWAINCGSPSLAESIPVYTKENLDSQLNYNIRLSLFTQLKYSPSDMTVTVPIVCLWYQQDLIEKADSRGSKFGVLKALLPFLGPTETEIISALLEKKNSNFTMVFSPFDFRCRILERQIYHIS